MMPSGNGWHPFLLRRKLLANKVIARAQPDAKTDPFQNPFYLPAREGQLNLTTKQLCGLHLYLFFAFAVFLFILPVAMAAM